MTINSELYQQACQLRYQLFYQPHGLSFDSVFNIQETESIHLGIIDRDLLLASGQLTQQNDQTYKIGQMVVHPNYQRQGLGNKLLTELITIFERSRPNHVRSHEGEGSVDVSRVESSVCSA